MKLLHIVGARPNFPKLAPVYRAARSAGVHQVVVHTGQHYDDIMSGSFFRELGIPQADINLEVGSASHAMQTARIMERLEPVLLEQRPDWLVVYGDVNSTMAAAIVASKLGIAVAHVEAGLRSHDRTMPEEINRIVTDRLASLLLTPSRDADVELQREGESSDKIVFVGNVMIDSLMYVLSSARKSGARAAHGVTDTSVIVTLHRPSNVDDPERLRDIMAGLAEVAEDRAVIFPVHPRTRQRLEQYGIAATGVRTVDPIGYPEMVDLIDGAGAVVTDSGGVQEETTALGVPCFTLRENTERPITITEGTNQLVSDPGELRQLIARAKRLPGHRPPEGWDGKAGERVVRALSSRLAASVAEPVIAARS